MSTDWSYRFRAPLREDIGDRDEFIRKAELDGVHFSTAIPIRNGEVTRPIFGPGIGSNSDFEDVVGVTVEDGTVKIGIATQNLERAAHDLDDGLAPKGAETRLSRLLDTLTRLTITRPGQIVGCIVSDMDMDFAHAHALVRIQDRIEMIRTPIDDYYLGNPGYPEEVRFEGDLGLEFITRHGLGSYELDYKAFYASLQARNPVP